MSVPGNFQAKSVRADLLLENLPAEIRRHFLLTLEYEKQKALVHASPVYHQQHLLDRHSVLSNSHQMVLGSNTIDACAVYQSGLVDFSKMRTVEKVSQFLETYREHSMSQHPLLRRTLTLDEVLFLMSFHHKVIKPLAWHYTEWALDNLAKESKEESEDQQSHKPLSRTEEPRIVRALYRFQLHCNLFGVSQYRFFRQWRLKFLDVDILNIFFCVFEPWEVEEIACIYTFTRAKYNQIFDDIRWDVHQENPKFEAQRRPPNPDGAFDFDSEVTRSMLLEGTISRGLKLLRYVLLETRDHAHLVSTMQEHIEIPRCNNIEDTLDETPQYMRRRQHPSDKDLKKRRRDPLPFQGDREDLPSLAWTLIWQGTYSNLFGWYIEDASRLWGYIMWDAARLEHTGAKDLLARQWKARWGDFDPRDDP